MYKRALIVCAVGLLCAGCGIGLARQIDKANKDFEQENYAQAEVKYRKIIQKNSFDRQKKRLVFLYDRLGQALEHQQKLEQAENAYVEADRVVGDAANLECTVAVQPLLHLAPIGIKLGRPKQAVLVAERALMLLGNCESDGAPYLLAALGILGQALQADDRPYDAQEAILHALKLAERTEKLPPETPLARYVFNAGTSYLQTGQIDLAEPYLDRAIAMLEERGESDTMDMANALSGKGFIQYERGNCEWARTLMVKAIQITEQLTALPDLDLAKMHFDLGCALQCMGQTEEALTHIKLALDAYRPAYGPDHATVQRIQIKYDKALDASTAAK